MSALRSGMILLIFVAWPSAVDAGVKSAVQQRAAQRNSEVAKTTKKGFLGTVNSSGSSLDTDETSIDFDVTGDASDSDSDERYSISEAQENSAENVSNPNMYPGEKDNLISSAERNPEVDQIEKIERKTNLKDPKGESESQESAADTEEEGDEADQDDIEGDESGDAFLDAMLGLAAETSGSSAILTSSGRACDRGIVGQIKKRAPACINTCRHACGPLAKAAGAYMRGGKSAASRVACHYRSAFNCINHAGACKQLIRGARAKGFRLTCR